MLRRHRGWNHLHLWIDFDEHVQFDANSEFAGVMMVVGFVCRHPVFNIFGEPVEILVTSKATNYSFCTGVQTSPPGGGPPPHKHEREEEIFMVIEGDFEFFDGREWSRFMKDEVKYSMRGNFHGFRNCGKTTGRLLFITTPGGLDEYFETICPLTLPEDMERLTEISKHYGYEFMTLAV